MILATLIALWLLSSGPQHVAVPDVAQYACITAAVYGEAEGEPYRGKLAVAAVVRERARRSQITPCAVVFARHQFSGLGRRVGRIHPRALAKSLDAAMASALNTAPVHECAGATHFDNNSRAAWARILPRVCVVGNHTFYKESP